MSELTYGSVDVVVSYSSVNITKLDVLSDLPEIKVAVGYKYKGSTLNTFPSSLQGTPLQQQQPSMICIVEAESDD